MKVKKLLEALSEKEKQELCHEIQLESAMADVRSVLKESGALKQYKEKDIRRIAEDYLTEEEIGRARFSDNVIKDCIDNYDNY